MDTQDPKWQKLTDELLSGVSEWRKQHPKATFAEIERETMKRTATLQAHLIEELAQISEAADWSGGRGSGLRGVWGEDAKAGQSRASAASARRTSRGTEARLCRLPAVRRRDFSPWMKS